MNQLITNPVLHGSIAAESLILYIQNTLSQSNSINLSPEIFANLEIGAVHILYSIREINSNNMHKEADEKTNKISHDKHQELYYYDYNVQKLFVDYINSQSATWFASYQSEKIRILTFNSQNNIQKQTLI